MDRQKKQELILTAPISKVIMSLAIPLMLSNLTQTLYQLVSAYYITRFNLDQITGVNIVDPMVFLLISIGGGFSVAGTSLISQYLGQGDTQRSNAAAGQLLLLSAVLSFLVGGLAYLLAPQLLTWMRASGEVHRYGLEFVRIMFLGTPTVFLMFSYNAIQTGRGDTVMPMVIGILSVLTNIVLAPFLMFYLDWQVTGAALATVFSRGIFVVYSMFLLFDPRKENALTFEDLRFRPQIMKELLRIGLPASFGQSLEAVGFMIMNSMILAFGRETIVAFNIGNRINGLVLMPAMGIGNALTTIVGQNLGAANPLRAKQAVKISMLLSFAFLVVGGLPLIFFARPVVMKFSTHPKVIQGATFYLILITLGIPLMGIIQSFVGTFQGAGRTTYSMVMMMLRLWLFRLPMLLLFKRYTTLGENGVWYSMILSNFTTCIVGYLFYRYGHWEKKSVKDTPKEALA